MIPFVPEGPKIPEEVVMALNNDELVLFCGAGVSKQHKLPTFEELVKKVCEELDINIDADPLLQESKKKKDYNQILDLIEGGKKSFLVKPGILRKTVIDILKYNEEYPTVHKSLLDLSTLMYGKGHRLVTTNFDELFFKAGLARDQIDSAPKLMLPRKEDWSHLTFLHGVIDEKNDPDGKHLILTKTDFGKAYLYDKWATNFIIRLFQDFKVLFIGYSLNDPIMHYLISAINYENKMKKSIGYTAYAFVDYKGDSSEEVENKWLSKGIQPIPYKLGKDDKEDHSLLYDTIKEWATLKNQGLEGKRNWLREKVRSSYSDLDEEKADSVISFLKVDTKLAEYFPKIDPPVDISWLTPFSKNKFSDSSENQKSDQGHSILKNLTQKTRRSQFTALFIWECLSPLEECMIKWLCRHLDKEELIHWVIAHKCILHPSFKQRIQIRINEIDNNRKNSLDRKVLLFWETVSNQNYLSNYYSYVPNLVYSLNEKYCPIEASRFIDSLEPYISFSDTFSKSLKKKVPNSDRIYYPELKLNVDINMNVSLKGKDALLSHAEDFSNLLKKAMDLAKLFEMIQSGKGLLCLQRPSIEQQ